ncbi:MAG: hypothetical protein M3068_01660 [Gemmatimonadota bacterium]|nr:hypothetical protein [Gemmatimonadota bacterium]
MRPHLLTRLIVHGILTLTVTQVLVCQAAPARTPPLSIPRVGLEVATGLVGTPLGFVGGGLVARGIALRLGASEERASNVASAGALAGTALGAAVGPTLVGTHGPTTGSYIASVAGAAAGELGSALLVRLNDRGEGESGPCRVRCVVSAAAIVLLPSVGATIGFNLSRRGQRGI